MSDDESLLTPEEASQFLAKLGCPIAKTTLAKLRCIGGGPIFQSFGRHPRYTQKRLREYANAKISPERQSTSQGAPPALRAAAPSDA